MLVELSVVEQRYHAVMEVLAAGASKTDVAARYGVSRQSVHEWVRRYQVDGLAGLADRSHRPHGHPAQMPAEVEAAVCELRRVHPRWGQRRLRHELGRNGCPGPVPSEASIYRLLVRRGLIEPKARRRRREDYRRWERPGPMQLWQLDVMGGVFLTSGVECKLVTGVDDHSRYLVIARSGPVVGRGLHLLPDLVGHGLRRLRHRRLLPADPGLAGRQQHAHRTGARRAETGDLDPASRRDHRAGRPGPPHRRRLPRVQYTSIAATERLAAAGDSPSIGSVGDALDNALDE